MRRRLILLATLGATLAVPAACGVVDPDHGQREELRNAVRQWTAHGFDRYEYVFQRTACECLPEWTLPYVIGVHKDSVINVRHADTGAPAPASFNPRTVSQLHALIEDAMDRNAYQFEVHYHLVFGYPTHISIDYDRQIADDEFTIQAYGLRPLQ